LDGSPNRLGIALRPPQLRKGKRQLFNNDGEEEEEEEEYNDDEAGGGSEEHSAQTQQVRRGSQELMHLLRVTKELDDEPSSPKKKAAK
jgi:hypothetical protein